MDCPHCDAPLDSTAVTCPRCGHAAHARASDAPDPLIGRCLPGGYVIEESLGAGGMGVVYRAAQQTLGRSVAVKVVHADLVGIPEVVARFLREARTASQLNHPHSLAIIDVGRTEDGLLYMVTEYLRGRDLWRVMNEEGLLQLDRVVDIVRQLLDALQEAHGLGIVHRDLKPDNIVLEPMRSGGDFVKVVDFRLAKVVTGSVSAQITTQGTTLGTPEYMSPEQCRALPLDGRSDLYSVGVNLFVLLTGRLPFEATTPPEHMLKHLVEPAPDPRQVAPDRGISEALAGVVLRALAKSPQDRFQSASEMSDALSRARADLGAAAPRSAASAPPPAARCPHCGETLDPGFKFCGACGGRVSLAPGMRPDAPAVLVDILEPAPGAAAPVSRDADLAWVLERVADGGGGPSAVAVVGPTGIGKIRLLRSLIDRERLRQRFVVLVEPDPWRLGALHHALRSAVGHLLALDGDGEVAATIAQASGPARLGMLELFDAPGGAGAREHASTAERPAGVLAALAWAVRRAADREGPPLVVLEDLDAMDHASRQTFAMAMTCEPALPASWVASFAPSFDPRWPAAIPRRSLVPLAADAAAGTLGRQEGAAVARGPDAGLPLYADHAARFAREGGSLPPPCLGDLVALRLSRLPAVLRRLLQAMAVLGDRAEVSEVAALCAGVDVRRSLEALARAGLAEADGDRARFSHPMVRQIAIGTTPAAVARELYRAATALASAPRLPIEVRAAWHLGADDAFEALVLLDQIGARALRRAEPDAAVDAYGRALRVARLDVGRGELDDSQSAVVGFSRKLAGALGAAGRARDAEAVLREALGFCEDSQGARAHVLEALYELLRAAGRKTEAADCLAGAVAAARQLGDKQLAGRLARRGLDEMS